MEDDLYFSKNGRRPQFFQKWKTTSIFSKREDDLNFFQKWKTKTKLNSKPNPSMLGLCTAQVMGFSLLSFFGRVTFLPEGLIIGFRNFAWGFNSQKKDLG
jgi:hypothetical protein